MVLELASGVDLRCLLHYFSSLTCLKGSWGQVRPENGPKPKRKERTILAETLCQRADITKQNQHSEPVHCVTMLRGATPRGGGVTPPGVSYTARGGVILPGVGLVRGWAYAARGRVTPAGGGVTQPGSRVTPPWGRVTPPGVGLHGVQRRSCCKTHWKR
jgi:hypothetical protein